MKSSFLFQVMFPITHIGHWGHLTPGQQVPHTASSEPCDTGLIDALYLALLMYCTGFFAVSRSGRWIVTCDVTPSSRREAVKLLIMFGSLIHGDQKHIWTWHTHVKIQHTHTRVQSQPWRPRQSQTQTRREECVSHQFQFSLEGYYRLRLTTESETVQDNLTD